MTLGGKTAVARQRGRRPPQILAARGSPSRWRGRWRVGSIIPCRAFVRQTPNPAKLRPPRPELRGASHAHAKMGGGGGVCDPRVFCASILPNFLARWRVQGRSAVRGPAGTGSVGDGVGEGLRRRRLYQILRRFVGNSWAMKTFLVGPRERSSLPTNCPRIFAKSDRVFFCASPRLHHPLLTLCPPGLGQLTAPGHAT